MVCRIIHDCPLSDGESFMIVPYDMENIVPHVMAVSSDKEIHHLLIATILPVVIYSFSFDVLA